MKSQTQKDAQYKDRRVSLQETMNKMARRMDGLLDDHERDHLPADKDVPDELRFWIAIDPVLSDLHKHLADARANQARIAARHGKADPITEVANDMVESAQSSLETRLIELRLCQDAKAEMEAMIIKAYDEKEAYLNESVRIRNRNFWREFAKPAKVSAKDKQAADSFWMIAASLMLLRYSLNRTLSIATTFSKASANDDFTFNRPLAGSA